MNYFYSREGRKTLYLTVREFAYSANVTKMTIGRWIVEGLPHVLVGDDVTTITLVPVKRANEWIKKRKV